MQEKIRICNAKCTYEKEPLKSPFGFKGNALTCLWQTVVKLESNNASSIGLGVQSVLWSDSEIFSRFGEEKGNEIMFKLTEFAVEICKNVEFESPFELLDYLFPKVYSYAKKVTNSSNLKATFVLNSLVPIDFAAWQLWAKVKKINSFDSICTFDGLHQEKLANIPLITYNTPIEDIVKMAKNGVSILKIKIGSDPYKNNDLEAMLEWDKSRIYDIHNAIKEYSTPYTKNGHILYYLDANGRYDSKERLKKLIDFAEKNDILERIIILEEPFNEDNKIFIGDLPVRIAADESAHSISDLKERILLGYKALTLKPIAKTLSMTIRMAEFARRNNIACFCADLTVNPIMVSWNQCVAARLSSFNEMKIGVLESNGEQNYINWDVMMKHHPLHNKVTLGCSNGIFSLNSDFYNSNGGIFEIPQYYFDVVEKR